MKAKERNTLLLKQKNNKLNNSYIAYSKYSFGSSDIEVCKVDKFYLSNMSKNKNSYQTNIFDRKDFLQP